MSKNVFDLAQEDTSLKRESFKEYSGSCPRCGGSDRFRVQPGRKDNGAWMCRGCWDPAHNGWGDSIEYLRQMRGMSFTAAKNYLAGEVKQEEPIKPYAEPVISGVLPAKNWQAWASKYVEQCVSLLWSSAGKRGLDYLHARGLKDATIKAAQLGYEEDKGIPCIVIPWHAERGQYWRINKRDIRPDVPHGKRYKNSNGSSNAGLYGGELLSRKYPVFIVEGELDALSIAQEAGDLPVTVVATGGLDCSRVPRWVMKLSRLPSVLIAYDNEPKGEEASHKWLNTLAHNATRYRPLTPAKDANAMLVQGLDVRAWVQSALVTPMQEQPVVKKSLDTCFTCGAASWIITDTNEAYCKACWKAQGNTPDSGEECCLCGDFSDLADDETLQPYCESCWSNRSSSPVSLTKEQFLAIAEQIAGVFPGKTEIRIAKKGTFTLEQRVSEIEQERIEQERQAWQSQRKRNREKAGVAQRIA